MVNISGLDKGAVIAALYNGARAQGMGLLHFTPESMTPAEGAKLVGEHLDYVKGRVMKVFITSGNDEFYEGLYDRDNGDGAAQRIVDSLRNIHEVVKS